LFPSFDANLSAAIAGTSRDQAADHQPSDAEITGASAVDIIMLLYPRGAERRPASSRTC
jgi:hypothetical protein